jgi:DNA-binding NtrC family response regulator
MQSVHRNPLNNLYSTWPVEAAAPATVGTVRSKLELGPDTLCDLHPLFPQHEATRALVGRRLADVERDLILDTLRFCLGNRTRAAKMLGVSIRTMRNRLKEFASDGLSIPPAEQRQGS